jgi:hypothetical protein
VPATALSISGVSRATPTSSTTHAGECVKGRTITASTGVGAAVALRDSTGMSPDTEATDTEITVSGKTVANRRPEE